jgi:tripeptide aminopeptidase
MIEYKTIRADVEEMLLERFLRYVRIDTTSDESIADEKTPSTEGQWDLIRLLTEELKELGIETVEVDEHGYLIARIPGNLSSGGKSNTLGLMAHVDTNSDAPGENIQPRVHKNYDGQIIVLEDGVVLDPAEWPLLSEYEGETLITTDGTTLLGADDKAGVAEIMTAVDWLLRHPEVPRGDLEIIFTPDEETGAGMNRFPLEKLKAAYCITMDGGQEGELETECYYAWESRREV